MKTYSFDTAWLTACFQAWHGSYKSGSHLTAPKIIKSLHHHSIPQIRRLRPGKSVWIQSHTATWCKVKLRIHAFWHLIDCSFHCTMVYPWQAISSQKSVYVHGEALKDLKKKNWIGGVGIFFLKIFLNWNICLPTITPPTHLPTHIYKYKHT